MVKADRTWTLLPLIEMTSRFFRDRGLESPRVDAELLMAHLLSKRRIDLYLEHDRPLSMSEVSRYREMVRSRSQGKPVQRIVGETEFYSLTLVMHDGVFIPRPESELLVDRAVEYFRARDGGEGKTAFDGGTGSGAVALAIARNVPGLRVVAVDLSPEAVACASENAERTGVDDRVETREGDMIDLLRALPDRCELVVSNPPYVTDSEMEELPREVGEHDPERALRGGADGLEIYGRLVPAAAAALVPGGLLLLEVSDSVAAGVAALVEAESGLGAPRIERDHAGHERVVAAEAIEGQ